MDTALALQLWGHQLNPKNLDKSLAEKNPPVISMARGEAVGRAYSVTSHKRDLVSNKLEEES